MCCCFLRYFHRETAFSPPFLFVLMRLVVLGLVGIGGSVLGKTGVLYAVLFKVSFPISIVSISI